jgi:hypothetical protein
MLAQNLPLTNLEKSVQFGRASFGAFIIFFSSPAGLYPAVLLRHPR